MFLVFSKEKITTYLVSILTVALLFCMVANFQTHKSDSIETSADTGKMLPIYKVKTDEKKVALTMNCAWNADDIDKILEVLSIRVSISFSALSKKGWSFSLPVTYSVLSYFSIWKFFSGGTITLIFSHCSLDCSLDKIVLPK